MFPTEHIYCCRLLVHPNFYETGHIWVYGFIFCFPAQLLNKVSPDWLVDWHMSSLITIFNHSCQYLFKNKPFISQETLWILQNSNIKYIKKCIFTYYDGFVAWLMLYFIDCHQCKYSINTSKLINHQLNITVLHFTAWKHVTSLWSVDVKWGRLCRVFQLCICAFWFLL